MVHAKMYSTIHKSALLQQINKTFLFFQNCKSIPTPKFPPQSQGTVTEAGQITGDVGSGSSRDRGREDTGTLRAGKAQSRLPAKKRDNRMTDKDARRDDTEHRGTGWDTEKQGERGEVSAQVGGRNWGTGGREQAWRGGRGNSKEQG